MDRCRPVADLGIRPRCRSWCHCGSTKTQATWKHHALEAASQLWNPISSCLTAWHSAGQSHQSLQDSPCTGVQDGETFRLAPQWPLEITKGSQGRPDQPQQDLHKTLAVLPSYMCSSWAKGSLCPQVVANHHCLRPVHQKVRHRWENQSTRAREIQWKTKMGQIARLQFCNRTGVIQRIQLEGRVSNEKQ